jgi:hypothetical protein
VEVTLPTFHTFADGDPLNRRVVEQMLIGVATRQYGRSLEPTGPEINNSASRCQWRTSRRMSRHVEDYINIEDLVAV